jgi:hypothetical protein
MTDPNLENSRRALALASNFLRAAGIRRIWIEQGGARGAVFLVETEAPGPSASDPPPEATAALRQALAGLHAPRWQARDGSGGAQARAEAGRRVRQASVGDLGGTDLTGAEKRRERCRNAAWERRLTEVSGLQSAPT